MKVQSTNILTVSGRWLAIFASILACHTAQAQTLVSGNISGTWTPAGNPYIATDNCTVPSGQTLTIQPGVIVWIGENLSVTANGLIQAVGTPTQRITFQSPVPSQYWNMISVSNPSNGSTNRFKYCDLLNANTAVKLAAYSGGGSEMFAEIMNCTFSNCISNGIYGEAQGTYPGTCDGLVREAKLNPVIKNCVFDSTSNGCVIKILGNSVPCTTPSALGSAYPKIIGNVFKNLTGTAFRMDIGSRAGIGSAIFVNNTLVNCRTGVDSQEPWNAFIEDNIFVGATNAVKTSGALSRAVSYNCFYGNATNFTGYPGTYGLPIIVNRNGTSCDLLYNIFQNPVFVGANDFYLQATSPCIDAGTPDWAFTDMCFPPSLGNSFPDQGAYGGPDACNWLDVVPKLPVQASMSASTNIIRLNWGALPRSAYQIQHITNFVSVGTNNWLDLTNGKVLAADKPMSLIVATNSNGLNKQFFRIQSLGRTPGN